jgi:hypothetical protein
MDKNNLNKELVSLVLKKNELNRLDYNDPEYDKVEEELHDMEDQFVENHGKYLEDVLKSVHDEFCPDNEVLLPIAYLANKYRIIRSGKGDPEFEVSLDEGVIVDVENYADKLTRLVLVPNPTRLLLQIHNSHHEEVWKLQEVS